MKKVTFKGYFEIKRNELFYYPHKSESDAIPHTLKVAGVWQMDSDHNLIFLVDESQNHTFGRSIKLSTKIEKVNKSALEFSLLDRLTPTLRKIKRIKLEGFWCTRGNRLAFSVGRDGDRGEMVFSNTWDVTENNQIIYLYTRSFGRRQNINSFLLQGRWSYQDDALIYSIENSKRSQLTFSVILEKTVINPRAGRLDFTIGAQESGDLKRKIPRSVSLWGKWRAGSCGLEFKTQFSGPAVRFSFGVNKKLSNDKEITFSLLSEKGKPLGFEITFLKKVFSGGSLFLRGKIIPSQGRFAAEETRIEAGVYLPW